MSRQFCDILNNSFPERARIPHFKLYLQCLKKLLINKRDFLYFKLTDRNNKAQACQDTYCQSRQRKFTFRFSHCFLSICMLNRCITFWFSCFVNKLDRNSITIHVQRIQKNQRKVHRENDFGARKLISWNYFHRENEFHKQKLNEKRCKYNRLWRKPCLQPVNSESINSEDVDATTILQFIWN